MALVFTYLGYKIHKFFYSFMLIEVVIRVRLLNNVIQAIYHPRIQIIVTLILFLLFIYYFTLIAMNFLYDAFPNTNDTSNIISCLLRLFDQTFKQDGGIGAYIDISLTRNYNPQLFNPAGSFKFYYDNIFNFLILIFIFQMFLSIIKDFFSRQREDQDKFNETLQSVCLICGLKRGDLEKIYSNNKNGFNYHINVDHNIYDYICYLNYLHCKTKKEKIVEANVWRLHLSNNYFFLPKDKCFKLKIKQLGQVGKS
jgi:inositol 1,4,5-triphosphate receptor type 1